MVMVTLGLLGRTEKAVPLSLDGESRFPPTGITSPLARSTNDDDDDCLAHVCESQVSCCAVAAGLRRLALRFYARGA